MPIRWLLVSCALTSAMLAACGSERAQAVRLDIRGTNALLAGHALEAMSALQEAIRIDPDYVDARINLASVQRRASLDAPPQVAAGYLAKAAENCQAALAREGVTDGIAGRIPLLTHLTPNPEPRYDEKARYGLILALHDQGADQLEWGNWRTARETLLRARDWFEASCERIPAFCREYRSARAGLEMRIGHSFGQQATDDPGHAEEHYRTARTHYEAAIGYSPEWAEPHRWYAHACLASDPEDAERAYRHFQRYLELGGDDEQARAFVRNYDEGRMDR